MLDVKKNRHLLTELLAPPVGYDFDRAVATTYSLDLMALLSVPLKLLRGEDATLEEDPIRLLQALRAEGQRLRVYHQEGNVLPVAKAHPLLCWLEEITVGIPPPEGGAFHPKIWVIRFRQRKGAGVKFRVVIGSRNLTFDRSADVVVALDGDITKGSHNKVKPLVDFLTYLNGHGAIDEDGSFLQQLGQTTFRGGGGFDYFRFHFSGYDGQKVSWLNKVDAAQGLVLSPFLSAGVIKDLARRCPDLVLVSRRLALRQIAPLPEEVRAYHFRDAFVDRDELQEYGEEDDTLLPSTYPAPAASPPTPTDLHAKIFSFAKGGRTYTWLGSGNATRSATQWKNVEAMIELRSFPDVFGPTKICADLHLDKPDSLFEQYVAEDKPEESDQDKLEQLVDETMRHVLLSLQERQVNGRVEAREGHFDIHLNFALRPLPLANRVLRVTTWSLFDEAHPVALRPGYVTPYTAQSLRPEQVSRWQVLCVSIPGDKVKIVRLLKVNLTGIPEQRDAKIITDILRDEGRFFQYLWLLLTGEQSVTNEPANDEGEWTDFLRTGGDAMAPLFERMARQLALRPTALDHLEELMTTLTEEKEGIVPARFRELWSVFSAFQAQNKEDE